MSVIIAKDRKEVKCPKCGNGWNDTGFSIEEKDVQWVKNGKKARIGTNIVDCYDPYPLRMTCKRCGKYFTVDYKLKEKVEFT